MPTLATLFCAILTDLRAAIAAHAARDRARSALLVATWGRIGRMAARFEALFARWRMATLPPKRLSRTGKPGTGSRKPGFPSARTWLVVTVRETASIACQLRCVLDHPDLPAFLAAAPQAGRILRPLCHMLGLAPLAPPLALPIKPRRPRPRTPKPPPPAQPRRPGILPPFRPRRFSPA